MTQILVKKCRACGLTKSLDQFNGCSTRSDGCQTQCRECKHQYDHEYRVKHRERIRQYKDKNRELINERARGRSRVKTLKKHGLTLEDFESMGNSQGWVCLICKRQPEDTLVVDHCYETEVVRGLLCRQCNAAIGLLGDTAAGVQKAADYLFSFEAQTPISQ